MALAGSTYSQPLSYDERGNKLGYVPYPSSIRRPSTFVNSTLTKIQQHKGLESYLRLSEVFTADGRLSAREYTSLFHKEIAEILIWPLVLVREDFETGLSTLYCINYKSLRDRVENRKESPEYCLYIPIFTISKTGQVVPLIGGAYYFSEEFERTLSSLLIQAFLCPSIKRMKVSRSINSLVKTLFIRSITSDRVLSQPYHNNLDLANMYDWDNHITKSKYSFKRYIGGIFSGLLLREIFYIHCQFKDTIKNRPEYKICSKSNRYDLRDYIAYQNDSQLTEFLTTYPIFAKCLTKFNSKNWIDWFLKSKETKFLRKRFAGVSWQRTTRDLYNKLRIHTGGIPDGDSRTGHITVVNTQDPHQIGTDALSILTPNNFPQNRKQWKGFLKYLHIMHSIDEETYTAYLVNIKNNLVWEQILEAEDVTLFYDAMQILHFCIDEIYQWLSTGNFAKKYSLIIRFAHEIESKNRINAEKIRRELFEGTEKYLNRWPRFVNIPKEIDGVSIVELNTVYDLNREGERQSHCVAGYANRCLSLEYKVFSLRSNEQSTTLGIAFSHLKSTCSVNQHTGYRNCCPCDTHEKVANQLLSLIRQKLTKHLISKAYKYKEFTESHKRATSSLHKELEERASAALVPIALQVFNSNHHGRSLAKNIENMMYNTRDILNGT